jgi:hypothetical protein
MQTAHHATALFAIREIDTTISRALDQRLSAAPITSTSARIALSQGANYSCKGCYARR